MRPIDWLPHLAGDQALDHSAAKPLALSFRPSLARDRCGYCGRATDHDTATHRLPSGYIPRYDAK
jgi:hypothetical protein